MDQSSSAHARVGTPWKAIFIPMKAKPMQFALQTRKSKTNSFQRERERKGGRRTRNLAPFPHCKSATRRRTREIEIEIEPPKCARLDRNPTHKFHASLVEVFSDRRERWRVSGTRRGRRRKSAKRGGASCRRREA